MDVFSTVASAISLIHISARFLKRINEFQTLAGGIPQFLQDVKTKLTLMNDEFRQIHDELDKGSVDARSEGVLKPCIEDCKLQLEQLGTILEKILPKQRDNQWDRLCKGMKSALKDTKMEQIMKKLDSNMQVLTRYFALTSSIKARTDKRLLRIRGWLSAPDPSVNYDKALSSRQRDTGLWLMNGKEYVEWKTSNPSPMWLHGIPGCGKSVLAAGIIQDLQQLDEQKAGEAVVIYFFFDFSDGQKQRPYMMLHSLVCQLSQYCFETPKALEEAFSSCQEGQKELPEELLLNLLLRLTDEFLKIYIVLDALDECAEQDTLMEKILPQINGWQLRHVHLVMTSRKEQIIEDSLIDLVNENYIIPIQNALVDEDIKLYVRQRLVDDKYLKKYDFETREKIENALTKGAHGMFRWAVCQMDALRKCVNKKMLDKTLASLPKTLDQTYERILLTLDDEYKDYVVRILRWLVFSSRPLSTREIAQVAALDADREPAFDEDEEFDDERAICSVCSSLVTVTSDYSPPVEWHGWDEWYRLELKSIAEVGGVVLAHYSVKEYLTSDRIQLSHTSRFSMRNINGNDFIATNCLKYIIQYLQSDNFLEKSNGDLGLIRYALKQWYVHSQKAKREGVQWVSAAIELLIDKDTLAKYLQLYDPTKVYFSRLPARCALQHARPILYASYYGIEEAVDLTLTGLTESEVNYEISYSSKFICDCGSYLIRKPALYVASAYGHAHVAELLISKGANVNQQGGEFGNALIAASKWGYEQVTKLLLDKGADINQQGGRDGTALAAASDGDHEQVVKLLLDEGADINRQGGEHGPALAAASPWGNEQIVKLLLDKGADVNQQGGRYGNALAAASIWGKKQVVKLLLDEGADVNQQGASYGTALIAASRSGRATVVQLLLDKGAKINAIGESGTALHVASYNGWVRTVKMLLDRGADIEVRWNGKTAYQRIMEGVESAGIWDPENVTPVDWQVVCRSYMEIAEMLYERTTTGEPCIHTALIQDYERYYGI